MNKLNKLKPVLCVIMSAFSVTALFLNLKTLSIFGMGSGFNRLVYDLGKSLSGNNLAAVLLFVFLIGFYYLFSFKKTELNQKIWSSVLSLLFAFFMVAGQSFSVNGSMGELIMSSRNAFKAMIAVIGYVILFYNLSNVLITVFLKPSKVEEKGKFPQWSFGSFFMCAGIIFACWFGYIIIFYPGTSSTDVAYQIQEFYGYPDLFYNMSEVKVSDTVFLTDHQPIAHTMVVVAFLKIGEFFGHQNYGLFLYNILQSVSTSMAFAFTVCYLAKHNVSRPFLKTMIAIYALVPMFPLIAINLSKNSLHGLWFIIYIICFFQYVDEPEKTYKSAKWNILLLVSVICQMLFLKYGVYIVLASGLYLIIQQRKQWKKLVPILIIPVILFMTVYTNVLLPACGVSPGSKNEKLSVPIQQTARYVRDHGDDVTPEEKELLNRMFIYDKLPTAYNPTRVDDVKWGAYRVDHDVPRADYFKVWFAQFKRHPWCYVEATANNVYGYFYPGNKTIGFYYKFSDAIKKEVKELDDVIKIGNPPLLDEERDCVKNTVESFQKSVVGFFFTNGVFYMWACMFMCIVLLAAKKYKYLAVMIPTAVAALFCVLSPMNANGRYFIPIVYATLFSVGMTLYACKNDKNVQEEKNG